MRKTFLIPLLAALAIAPLHAASNVTDPDRPRALPGDGPVHVEWTDPAQFSELRYSRNRWEAQQGDWVTQLAEYLQERAAAVFRVPGAMDAPCAVSYGPVPGSVYCGHRFLDVLVHGWDVATSTGQDTALDPELVAACWEVLEPQLEMLQASGAFGTEVVVGDDADLQTRLLAALGRAA